MYARSVLFESQKPMGTPNPHQTYFFKPWGHRGNFEALLHRVSACGRQNSHLLGREFAGHGDAFGVETWGIDMDFFPPWVLQI